MKWPVCFTGVPLNSCAPDTLCLGDCRAKSEEFFSGLKEGGCQQTRKMSSCMLGFKMPL